MRSFLISLPFLLLSFVTSANDYVFFEPVNDTLVKIYFDENGDISHFSKAKFFRIQVAKDDMYIFDGDVKDYYLNDQLAYMAYKKEDKFCDSSYMYYENGDIWEQGKWDNGEKVGTWNIYYKNGQLNRSFSFNGEEIKFINSFTKSGKKQIIDGEGKFKFTCIKNFQPPQNVLLKGRVSNGYLDGICSMEYFNFKSPTGQIFEFKYDIIEKYNQGNFVSGTHDMRFDVKSHDGTPWFGISNKFKKHEKPLMPIIDYNIHESAKFLNTKIDISEEIKKENFDDEYLNEFDRILVGNKKGEIIVFPYTKLSSPFYKGKQNFNIDLIPDLGNKFIEYKDGLPRSFFLLIEFSISKNGDVENLCVFNNSNLNDQQVKLVNDIILNVCYNNWSPAINMESNKMYESSIFIPIFRNGNDFDIGMYNLGLHEINQDLFKLLNN